MSIAASITAMMGIATLLLVVWLLRWAWHRHFGTPLDMDAERERLRQDVARSYRFSSRVIKWYFRR
jgi:hypothetical protein